MPERRCRMKGHKLESAATFLMKVVPWPTFVRLGMKYAANSLQLGMTCDLVQIEFEIVALGSTTSHNAFQWIVWLIGEREQMPGLLEHVGFVDIGLKVDRLHDVQPLGSGEIVGHSEGAVQLRKRVEPPVTKKIQIPQMLVRVYNLHGMIGIITRSGGNSNRRPGKLSNQSREKLLPSSPTTRLRGAFLMASASAS